MRRTRICIHLATVMVLLATGVSVKHAPGVALAQSTGTGTLVYGSPLPLEDTLNPYQTALGTDSESYTLLFAPILTWDPQGKPFSTLTDAVPTLQNHLAYRDGDNFIATYKLKEGSKWSDGQPVTSDDILFSFDIYLDIYGSSPFTSVGIVDPRTVTFHLPFSTSGNYLQDMHDLILMPKHAFPSETAAAKTLSTDPTYSYTSEKFVTSGPYIVSTYDHFGGRFTLKPNPNYSGPPPALDTLEYRTLPDRSSLISSLGTSVDVASGFSPADLPALRAQPGVAVNLLPGITFNHVIFNTTVKPFDNANIRKAFAEAVDREALCEQVLNVNIADCKPLQANAPLVLPAPTQSNLQALAFNANDARNLLTQGGYGGQPVTLTVASGSATRTAIANSLADSWRNVLGINVTIQSVSLSQLFSTQGILQNGTFGITILPELASHDPVSALDQFDSTQIPSPSNLLTPNFGRVHDTSLDTAILGARNVLDPVQRTARAGTVLQQVLDNAYDVPLFFTPAISAHDSRIQDFVPNPSGDTWNAFEWGDARSGAAPKPLPDTSGADTPTLWKPAYLIDGLKTTGYETGPGQVTNQSVTIGFKNNALYTISQIWLDPSATAGHPSDMEAMDVEMQISTTDLAEASFKSVGSVTLSAEELRQVPITPQKARYVRVVLKNNHGNPTFTSLSEFMAVGSPTPAGPLARNAAILPSLLVNKPAKLGAVKYIRRGLSVTHAHKKAQRAKVKAPLYGLDRLRTAKRQGASLQFLDKTTLHLNQLTDAVLSDAQTTTVRSGEVDEILTPGSNHVVKTNAIAATAIGTNFDVKVTGSTTMVTVIEGVVQVQSPQGSVVVKAGQQTTATVGSAPSPPTAVDAASTTAWMNGYPKIALPMNLALDTNGGHIVGTSS